jgi:2-acylglycerol O-acyltransferase 2
MLEPLHDTCIGAQLLFFVMGLSWTLGGAGVAVACAGCADYTYGMSFAIFGVVAIESIGARQAWSIASLLFSACLGPKGAAEYGFARFWFSWATLAVMSVVMWFVKFPRSAAFVKAIQDIGFRKYFHKVELRGALESIEKEKCMFGFHPHGILSTGFSINGVWGKQFHELAGRDTQFLIDKVLREDNPFFKIICDLHGGINTLSKSRLHKLMGSKANIAMVPGGFEDATAMHFNRDITVLRKRTGFIKYALQYGYRVYPVYTFGESSTHYTFTGLLNFRLWLNKYGIPAVVVFGCPWLPLMPRKKVSILTCVGDPLELPKIDNPTKEDVEKWHAKYCDALRKLFDDKKKEAGLPDHAKLEIW